MVGVRCPSFDEACCRLSFFPVALQSFCLLDASKHHACSMLSARFVQQKPSRLVLITLCILASIFWFCLDLSDPPRVSSTRRLRPSRPRAHHPLDDVISQAVISFKNKTTEETHSLRDAVAAYIHRRGRYPPPGFDKWHERAREHGAVIVESFFDQIYEDIEPFWGLEPADIRGALVDWKWTLRVRNGRLQKVPQGRARSVIWSDMIGQIAADLPDMDIAINPLDEPRIFAPWEKVEARVARASKQRERMMSLPVRDMSNRLPEWKSKSEDHVSRDGETEKDEWVTKGELWPHVLSTCPPETGDHKSNQNLIDKSANWTISKDICNNRDWANIHGTLIRPATMSIRTDLVPMFSDAKLQGSNDILLPAASYFGEKAAYTSMGWFGEGNTATPWHKKVHGLVWRGKATGGLVEKSKWQDYQRQRLVAMLNGSDTALHDNESKLGSPTGHETTSVEQTGRPSLSSWLTEIANVGFTDYICPRGDSSDACKAMAARYGLLPEISMKKQYGWKYLPDIDGNSLSGRFRAFMRSNSAPMKATIFKEWHDSRLASWVHFIPLDITLRDLWSTMAYFLGFGGDAGHDEAGERIATEGRLWAEKVLRKEDMLLYAHRVLLEYGRLGDDERDTLGLTLDMIPL